MRGRTLIALGAVLAGLSACGMPAGEPPPAALPPPTEAPADPAPGLAAWAGFPVRAVPRPLVLVGPALLDPRSGFTHEDDKLSYGSGAITMPARLPAGPATAAGFPIIAAATAARRFHPAGSTPAGTPLRVTSVRLATAVFSTDRGERTLPAWLFTFAGIADPAAVLAVDRPARWAPAGRTDTLGGGRATVSPDGRTLTVTYLGGRPGTGPCAGEMTAAVVESAATVVVRFALVPAPTLETPYACTAIGIPRTTAVTLGGPLGARVVLTPAGDPYQVLSG